MPPPPAPKPSAGKKSSKEPSLPVPQPNTLRKRRSNTDVSELERRSRGESKEGDRGALQDTAGKALKLNPPTPKKVFLSAPLAPGQQTPSRLHIRPPRSFSREKEPEDDSEASPQEPREQLLSPDNSGSKHEWNPVNRPTDSLLLPQNFRDDPWWLEETPGPTPSKPKQRPSLMSVKDFRNSVRTTTRTTREPLFNDDDDSDDGLHTQYPPSQLDSSEDVQILSSQPKFTLTPSSEDVAKPSQKAATLQPKATQKKPVELESQQSQEQASQVPSSQPPLKSPPPSSAGGTSKKSQKAAPPQRIHTKSKATEPESEQEEEEIKFISRIWWGKNAKTPLYKNTKTRAVGDFDIRSQMREMDKYVKYKHAEPNGLHSFRISVTATPNHKGLAKGSWAPVLLEKDELDETWDKEVIKQVNKYTASDKRVNLDFKYAENTSGVTPAPSKEKPKEKSVGTPTQQLAQKEKEYSEMKGHVVQLAAEWEMKLHCSTESRCPHKTKPCFVDRVDGETHLQLTGRDVLIWANHYCNNDGVYDLTNPPELLLRKWRLDAVKSSRQLKKLGVTLQPWQQQQVAMPV